MVEFVRRRPDDRVSLGMNAVAELVPLPVGDLKFHPRTLADLKAVGHAGSSTVVAGAYNDIIFGDHCAVSPPETGRTRCHNLCYGDEIRIPARPEVFLLFGR